MFSSKMGWHVAGIAGLVAHVIHTNFTYSVIFVRSFCSIYVDNFKSQVFPYVRLVVAGGSFVLCYYSHHKHQVYSTTRKNQINRNMKVCKYTESTYCETVINCGVLIFANFEVHLNHENKNLTKYKLPIYCCL